MEFPLLVPVSPDNPASESMRHARKVFSESRKPALVMFSDGDPITHGGDRFFRKLIPSASEQPEITIEGGSHFLQEDKPQEIAEQILAFIAHPFARTGLTRSRHTRLGRPKHVGVDTRIARLLCSPSSGLRPSPQHRAGRQRVAISRTCRCRVAVGTTLGAGADWLAMPPGRAHLVGIAGSGMRSLADLLAARGWQISGSDPALETLSGIIPNAKVVSFHAAENVRARLRSRDSSAPRSSRNIASCVAHVN